jgi:GTPase SAR1 family protein
MSLSLKICVVGPKGAGKTAISNFLAGQSATVEEGRYDATVGVRILEYEGVVSGGEWVSGGVMQW